MTLTAATAAGGTIGDQPQKARITQDALRRAAARRTYARTERNAVSPSHNSSSNSRSGHTDRNITFSKTTRSDVRATAPPPPPPPRHNSAAVPVMSTGGSTGGYQYNGHILPQQQQQHQHQQQQTRRPQSQQHQQHQPRQQKQLPLSTASSPRNSYSVAGGGGGLALRTISNNNSNTGNKNSKTTVGGSKYVRTLKEQIKYLEMECQLLKENSATGGSGAQNSNPNTNETTLGAPGTSTSNSSLGKASVPASLADAFEGLKAQFATMEFDHNDELKNKDNVIRQQRDLIASLSAEVEEYRGQSANEMARASDNLREMKEAMARELENYNALREENETSKVLLKETEQQLQDLRAEMQALDSHTTKEIAQLTLDAKRLAKLNDEASARVVELEAELGDAAVLLHKEREKHKHALEMQNEHDTQISKLKASVAVLHNDVARTKYQLERSQQIESQTRDECERLAGEVSSRQEDLSEARLQCEQVSAREIHLLQERENVVRMQNEAQHKAETMTQQAQAALENLKGEEDARRDTSAKLAEARAAESDTRRALEHAVSRSEVLQQRVSEQELTVASLGSQLSVARAEAETMSKGGAECKQQLIKSKAEIARLSAQVQEMKARAELFGDLEQLTQSLNGEEFRNMLTNNLKLVSRVDKFINEQHQHPSTTTDQQNNNMTAEVQYEGGISGTGADGGGDHHHPHQQQNGTAAATLL